MINYVIHNSNQYYLTLKTSLRVKRLGTSAQFNIPSEYSSKNPIN